MKTIHLALIASLVGPSGALAQSVQVVRLGHVGPTSGGMAHYGKDTRNAAVMAIDDLNAQGLVIAGKRIEFQLETEDDAGDPRQGTLAAQKLCDSGVAAVIGHINSGSAIPASRIYRDCGIPFLSPGSTNPKLTQQGYKNTFRMLASDKALGAAVATYAARELKVKTVALVDDRTAYGQGVSEVFKARAKAAGIEVVAEEFTNDKATDFSAILTKIKGKNVDAIFFAGGDGQAGPMLRQMHQLGMSDTRMLGGDGICTSHLGELAGNAPPLSRVVCAEGGASLARMPGGNEWKKRYDARFPNEYVLFSPYTYDGFMVVADAMKRANSVEPGQFGPRIFAADLKGVSTHVRFDEAGDLQAPAITLNSYRNGVKTPLE
ncbi:MULTISPECIES: branched-chain amino acid ABC transporter substrate-binding protein [Variovorax]|uniref:branched-chain amino acid ABC transporter substrate-binding protein n=1 Tax=Variovorax TaxID=34072 RepID=UPI00038224FE